MQMWRIWSCFSPLFNLHDLAVEDCLSEEDQRPKIEIYESHYFIVVNSIRFDDEEIFCGRSIYSWADIILLL